MSNKKYYLMLVINIIILISISIVAINLGKADLSALKPNIAKIIFYKIRLPRVIAAISVGSGLALSGTLFQSLLNNPLADSYTLGIASGSAFGACLAIFVNITYSLTLPIQPFALVFGLMTIYLVIYVSKFKGSLSSLSLVLAGIIIGSIFSAGLSLLKNLAGENVESMVSWLMGSLTSKTMDQVLIMTFISIICFIISYRYAHELNIITLGKNEARSVGVNYDKIYKTLILIGAIVTSFAVSLSGIIGFVGLVVPHIARMIVGADNKKIIPLSIVMGGIFLLIADTLTRTILAHEIPVGILTTLVGGPFFIYIYATNKGVKLND